MPIAGGGPHPGLPADALLRARGVVLVVTRADRIGGAQVHVLDLARGLQARGVPAVVVTGPPGPFTAALEQAGISHRSLPQLVRPIRPLADLRALLGLRSVLQELKPALVAAHSTKATWIGRLAAASLGIPCVITVHGWPWASSCAARGPVTRKVPQGRAMGSRGTGRKEAGWTRRRTKPKWTRRKQTVGRRAGTDQAGQGCPAPRRSCLRRLQYTGAQDGAGHHREAVTLAVARWGERLLARFAAAVITVSHHDYREGLRHGLLDARRTVVIPNGVADPAAGRGEGRGETGGAGGSGGNGGTGQNDGNGGTVRNGGPQATRRLPAEARRGGEARWAGQDGAADPLRIVMVARFEPPKDHTTLLRAIALLEQGSLGSPGPGRTHPLAPQPPRPNPPAPRSARPHPSAPQLASHNPPAPRSAPPNPRARRPGPLPSHRCTGPQHPGAPQPQPVDSAACTPMCPLPRQLTWVVELVGDGPALPAAAGLARALGIEHRVRFLGPQPDGAGAVRGAAVAVLCSRREGLPLAILEAMATGVPVVATAVGGIPEAVRPGVTGYLVPPGDTAAVARYLRRLLVDPVLRWRMGAAARARYEAHFTVDRMVDATLAVYRRVCGGGSNGPGGHG